MASVQAGTHSFIIKVWLEQTGDLLEPRALRGRITHVPSGATGTFTCLEDIVPFIATYVRELGAQQTWTWRMRQWCRRLVRRLRGNGD